MEGRKIIALVAGGLLGFFGWKALDDDAEDVAMTNDQNEALEPSEIPAGAPPTLNTSILRGGGADPTRALRALREGFEEGDPEEDRAATDEMKRFLRENPIRL